MTTTKATKRRRPALATKSKQRTPKKAAADPATSPATASADRAAADAATTKSLMVELPIDAIDTGTFNPRTEFDQAELDGLASSLKEHGLLQPIIVRTVDDGRYQLIAGERRFRAAKAAGWETVPATVRNATDEDALTWTLVENLDRADLNPIDQARGLARLHAPKENGGCGMTFEEIGDAFGRGKTWAGRIVRLLNLPDIWLQRIASGELKETMGYSLSAFADRPAVLARIEDDMSANPWAWRTGGDFDRNIKLLAEEGDISSQPAVDKELKPMRAAPGESEDPATIRRRKYAKQTAPSTRVGDDEAVLDATDVPDDGDDVGGLHAGDDVPRGDSPSPHATPDVRQIVAAIGQLDEIDDLNQITLAIDRRRRQLTESPS